VPSRFAGLEQETAKWPHYCLNASGRWLLVWPSCYYAGMAKLVLCWLMAAVVVLVDGCSQVSEVLLVCSSRFVALLLVIFLSESPL
jgi:hypothetical protein